MLSDFQGHAGKKVKAGDDLTVYAIRISNSGIKRYPGSSSAIFKKNAFFLLLGRSKFCLINAG